MFRVFRDRGRVEWVRTGGVQGCPEENQGVCVGGERGTVDGETHGYVGKGTGNDLKSSVEKVV